MVNVNKILIFAFFLSLVLTLSGCFLFSPEPTVGAGEIDTSANLISCWDFENNLSDSVGSMDFTALGTAIYNSSNVKIGSYSLEVVGDKYSSVQDQITSTPLTLNYWVEIDSDSGNNELVGIWDGSSWYKTIEHTVSLSLNTRVWAPPYSVHGETIFNINVGTWHFLSIVVHNDSAIEWYVDGVSTLNTTETMTFSSAFDELFISKGDAFNGRIDGMTLYNTNLSSDVIETLYSAGNGLSCSQINSVSCSESLTNTSWSTYTNTTCITGGFGTEYDYSRYLTQYDANSCGTYANTTFWDNGTTYGCTIPSEPVNISSNVVINLTFDNESDPWKDSTGLHTFTNNNGVDWYDRTVCKWYGCAGFNDSTLQEYLSTTANFEFDGSGYAVEFWIYPQVQASADAEDKWGAYWIKSYAGTDGMGIGDNNQGLVNYHYNTSGDKVTSYYSYANPLSANVWYHVAILHNASSCTTDWIVNGVVTERSQTCADLTDTATGKEFDIGISRYWTDGKFLIDEFIWYNGTEGLTTDYFANHFTEQQSGTPPDLDIYITNITYTLPFNWSDGLNRLEKGGTMDICVGVANEGVTNATGSFDVTLEMDDGTYNNWVTSLGVSESKNLCYTWTTSVGYIKGNVIVDSSETVSEDLETNNELPVYIPFMDRPYLFWNTTEWYDTLWPYMKITGTPAYDAYQWGKGFSCSAVNPSYTGNSVDPYGKKARECALSCLYNNYTQPDYPSKAQCDLAKDHLDVWLYDIDPTTYTNVQAVHEISQVAAALDIMWPVLSEEEALNYSRGLEAICQQVTNLENTRPDLDDKDTVNGGNGRGFGDGIGTACTWGVGLDSDNPTMIQDVPQQYWSNNAVDEWRDRQEVYLAAFKNDSEAQYQEGMAYLFYGNHIVESLFHQQKYGLESWPLYSNSAFCGMANTMITQTLDWNYNGDTLRNSDNRLIRFPSRGDSNSYEDPGSGTIQAYATVTYYGLLCGDRAKKEAIAWIRDYAYNNNDDGLHYLDAYLYGQLIEQITSVPDTVDGSISKFQFDQANDIWQIRSNYTYVDDTIFQIDAGEERMSGHSTSPSTFLYVMGEEMFMYPQTPYEDDMRTEATANAISLQNWTLTVEGQSSYYNQDCYTAEFNAYYGMVDCPSASLSQDWPDYRRLPANLSGDIESYIGSKDGTFGAAYVWQPYYLTDNVEQIYVLWDDALIFRNKVTGNTEGQGVYRNFLSITDEIQEQDVRGTNWTIKRVGKDVYVDTSLSYSNVSMSLQGGNTSVQVCYDKTNCADSFRGTGQYYRKYYYTPSNNADFIINHQWNTGTGTPVSSCGSSDKGSCYGNKAVIFDTTNNGVVVYSSHTTDGIFLALDATDGVYGSSNATYFTSPTDTLISINDSIGFFVQEGTSEYVVDLNTMGVTETNGLDSSKTVNVVLNLESLSDSTTNEEISFNVSTGVLGSQIIVNGSVGDRTVYQDGILLDSTIDVGGTCTPSLVNSSWSTPVLTECIGGLQDTSSYLTQYDSNYCEGSVDVIFWDNDTIPCEEVGTPDFNSSFINGHSSLKFNVAPIVGNYTPLYGNPSVRVCNNGTATATSLNIGIDTEVPSDLRLFVDIDSTINGALELSTSSQVIYETFGVGVCTDLSFWLEVRDTTPTPFSFNVGYEVIA